MHIFEWSMMWKFAGPFIIMAITALVIGFVGMIVLALLPKGIGRELARVLVLCCLAAGSLGSIYIAAGIWGWRG